VIQKHLRPVDRAAGWFTLVVSGLAAVLAVGLGVYGVVNRDPSDLIIAGAVALSAAWTGRLVLGAFRRNSRELLPNAAARIDQAVAKAGAKSTAKPLVAFTGAEGPALSATLRMRRRLGSRADRRRGYELWVDGGLVGDLSPGDTLRVAITPGSHTVHLAIDWCRSRRIPFVIASEETLALVCEPAATPLTLLLNITLFCKRYVKVRVDTEAAAQEPIAAGGTR
jgi:hypothetical protein